MRRLLTRLAVGLTTFSVGVCAAALLVSSPRPAVSEAPTPVAVTKGGESVASRALAESCAWLWARTDVSDEDKAVAAAQGFVSRMGYTNGIGGSASMAAPCVEVTDESEESFESRFDTLERRAYGLSRLRKGDAKGWTVVFRYTKRVGGGRLKTGRAVTMDENFRNLRVEHSDFFLEKVGKKL